MNWDLFKNKFNKSWHEKMKPFIESQECNEIFKVLKEKTAGGVKIAPASSNTFRAFLVTPLDELKCVIIGGPPYSEFENDLPIATGLFLDCSITKKVTSELKSFYNGIEREYYNGLNLEYVQDWSLDYLAENGVLLLNNSLTIEKDAIDGDQELWKPFISYILNKVIPKNIPIIFVDSSLLKIGKEWESNNIFSEANKQIEINNMETIMWLNINVPF